MDDIGWARIGAEISWGSSSLASAATFLSDSARPSCRRWFSIRSSFTKCEPPLACPGKLFPIEGADHFSILSELRRPDGAWKSPESSLPS
jgi:hypothetical protein